RRSPPRPDTARESTHTPHPPAHRSQDSGPRATAEPPVATAPGQDRGMVPIDFHRDGFAVLRGVLTPSEIQSLRTETVALCRGARGTFDGLALADPAEPDDSVIRRYLCV